MGAPAGSVTACVVFALIAAAPHTARTETVTLVSEAYYPEGPLWHEGKLYYAEMTRDRIVVREGTNVRTFWRRKGCGPTSIAPIPGGFVVACHIERVLARIGTKGKTIGIVTKEARGRSIGNPNDSIADGNGGVYFTSSGLFIASAPATGRVFYLPPSGPPREVADNIHYGNGVVLSPNRRHLYVSAHIGRRVLRFEIGPKGRLSHRRVHVRLKARAAHADRLAGPDGLAFDRHGNLFLAEYGAGRILVFAADRRLHRIITLKNRYVTNLEFGPRGKSLYVTAPASNSVWPYKGAVLRIDDPLR